MIDSLRSESGIVLREKTSLVEAYKDWLNSLTDKEFKRARPSEIIRFYIEGQNKPRHIDKQEFVNIKKHAREEGEAKFKYFLHNFKVSIEL